MSYLKVLGLFLPFIREMVLGGKSLKEAFKTNKMRVLIAALIVASITINFFGIPKFIAISADYVILNRKYNDLLKKQSLPKTDENSLGPTVPDKQPRDGEEEPKPPEPPRQDDSKVYSDDHYDYLKNYFDDLDHKPNDKRHSTKR